MNKSRKKNCGNCDYFFKLKNRSKDAPNGLCDLRDYGCSTDHGSGCKDHKFKKYKRIK